MRNLIDYAFHRACFYLGWAHRHLTTTGLQVYYASAKESYTFWSTPNTFMGFTTADFKDFHAIGAVANEDAETSFLWHSVGDNGEAHGSFQDHDDRVALIKKGCGIDVSSPNTSHLDMLRAALYELNTTEKHSLQELLATTNAYDAAVAWCKYFERAGAPNATSKRGVRAIFWAQYFKLSPSVYGTSSTKLKALFGK
jgi:hypothetical protein